MKKQWLFIGLLLPLFINARQLHVGVQQAYPSIHAALEASLNGDTILVEPGTYKEKNIAITKAIVLLGIKQPVLDGEHSSEILSIKCSNVTVGGFKIQHCAHSDFNDIAAVKIYNAHNVTIADNVLDDNFFGIYVQFGINCHILRNKLQAYGEGEVTSGNGIHCWKSDSLEITGNYITGHRDGIYFEFVTNSAISQNNSVKNIRYGLHFMFSHNDTYISNIFSGNGSGVAVMYTHGIQMLNNHFENSWGDAAYGLLLKDISDSNISGNYFTYNTAGIFMESSNRIKMERNMFGNNGWAMKIQASCQDNKISYSNFSGNTFDIATNGSLVLNTFDHNYWDKYEGYDLDRNTIGDVPYHPISVYSMIVERNPAAMMLFRSFIVALLDKTEKVLPSIIPENLKDNFPLMKPVKL